MNYSWKSRTGKSNDVGMSQDIFLGSRQPILAGTVGSEVRRFRWSSKGYRGAELQEDGFYVIEPPERLEKA